MQVISRVGEQPLGSQIDSKLSCVPERNCSIHPGPGAISRQVQRPISLQELKTNVREGHPGHLTVIIEFESLTAAQEAYETSEYQDMIKLRQPHSNLSLNHRERRSRWSLNRKGCVQVQHVRFYTGISASISQPSFLNSAIVSSASWEGTSTS